VEAVEELYEGNPACKANVDLIGRDTTASNTGLVISVTALGEQEKIKLFIDLVLRMHDSFNLGIWEQLMLDCKS
jgi:thiamine monophosphate kinase